MSSTSSVQKDFAAVLTFRVGTTISYQMMMVAVGWHLFNITNSVISLGLLGLVELIPFFLFALYAGHLVDTFSRRGIGAIASLIHLFIGIFLMCVSFGIFSPAEFYIYLSVGALGIGRAFLRPAYQSIFGEVIPRNMTSKYAAYASSAFQICVVSGPAIGGFLIAFLGLSWTYLIAGLFAVFGLYGIFRVRVDAPDRQTNHSSFLKSLVEGIEFVRHHPLMLSAMSIDMFAVLFGGAVAMLPAFVKDVLHLGPEALGILRAAPAIGSILTGIYFARHPLEKNSGQYLLGSVFGFGASIIAFSLTNELWVSGLFLFLSGCFDSISVVIRTTIFQLTSPDHMRGRIGSINGIFIGSSNELGAFESGIAASIMGLAPSIAFGGFVTLLVAIGFYQFTPILRNLHIKDLMSEQDTQ
jgi:MFS family permease